MSKVLFYVAAAFALLLILFMCGKLAAHILAESWRAFKRNRGWVTTRECEPSVFIEQLLLYQPPALLLRRFVSELTVINCHCSAYQLSFIVGVNEQHVRYRTMIDYSVFPSELECGTHGFTKETSPHWLALPLLVRVFTRLIYNQRHLVEADPVGWRQHVRDFLRMLWSGFPTEQQSSCGQIDNPIAIIEKVLHPHEEAAVA